MTRRWFDLVAACFRRTVQHVGYLRPAVALARQHLPAVFGDHARHCLLLELMALPNVSLGVIPLMTERQAVGSAGFWIFDDTLVLGRLRRGRAKPHRSDPR